MSALLCHFPTINLLGCRLEKEDWGSSRESVTEGERNQGVVGVGNGEWFNDGTQEVGPDTGTLSHCYSVLLSWGSSGEANMHIYCCCCSVAKSCLTLCDPMDCSMPDSSVFSTVSWRLLKFMSFELMMLSNHLILCCSPPFAFNLSQPQGLFQGAVSLHQVVKVLKLQLQHQSFQWIFRVDFL